MQQELIAGDSLNFLTGGGAYPASAGWALVFTLVPRNPANPLITINTTAEGDDFRTAVAATVTATWAADSYTWRSRVDKGGEKYTVDSGQIVIKPDLAAAGAGYDGRSLAEKALDDARTAYAGFTASNGTKRRYRIGDREMEFSSSSDIVLQINYWQIEVKREARHKALAKGLPDPHKTYVRLNRE